MNKFNNSRECGKEPVMEQQDPTAAGQGVERLTSTEQQALERVLERLSVGLVNANRAQLNGEVPAELGWAARRMVLAAFRPYQAAPSAQVLQAVGRDEVMAGVEAGSRRLAADLSRAHASRPDIR